MSIYKKKYKIAEILGGEKVLNSVLKKFIKGLIIFLIIVSALISSTVVYLVATNFNNIGHTIKVYTLIKSQFIENVSTKDLIRGAAEGMVEVLDDPYSVYLDEVTYESLTERMRGVYGGVGLLITKDEEGRLVVVSPFRGTPAHREGIATGDFIIKINNETTDNMELEMAASLMQGEPGTEVTITVSRENGDTWDVTLVREVITIPSVDSSIIDDTPGIGYINLSTFNETTSKELGEQLKELRQKGIKGLIVDLRNNPGGTFNASIEVADYFVPEGPVVHIVNKYNTSTYNAVGPAIDIPLVVLVNSGTASASEIVAGAIQDTGVGILVGEKTFGKGIVQSIFPLNKKEAIKLTTARYFTPNRRDINQKGIEPDYEVILTPEKTAEALLDAPNPKIDPQLQKAIEVIQSKLVK
jgi:carboxyl-terminal processing protease